MVLHPLSQPQYVDIIVFVIVHSNFYSACWRHFFLTELSGVMYSDQLTYDQFYINFMIYLENQTLSQKNLEDYIFQTSTKCINS